MIFKMLRNRPVIAWALYDWANSAFATTVMAGFFPIFFKQYYAADLQMTQSSFYLGAVNTLASLAVFLSAPLLGILADQSFQKKRYLMIFTVIGSLATAGLFFVAKGSWAPAALLYFLGCIGFSLACNFYDSLLIDLVPAKLRHRASTLGYALGYLGGGLLFTANVLMVLKPRWFFLADSSAAIQWAFLSVGIWWLLFSLPLWRFVEEKATTKKSQRSSLRAALKQLLATFKKIRQYRTICFFLIGYWFYIDGVDTVIRMAADYGLALGFPRNTLITALLITQFIGLPATLIFGKIGDRLGAKKGILIALTVYILITVWAAFMTNEKEFYLLACLVLVVWHIE
jgi:UMF1 family MFS transporter